MQADTITLEGRYYRCYPPEQHLGHAEEELILNVPGTAFLVVDIYGLGFDQGTETEEQRRSKAFQRQKDIVINHIKPALRAARCRGLKVIYLTNALTNMALPGSHFLEYWQKTEGCDYLQAWKEPAEDLAFSEIVAPREGEPVIKKQMYSGFFGTDFDQVLRNHKIKNLVAVGFDARICLRMTLVDAFYRDFRVVLLRDCTSTIEYPETQEKQLMTKCAIRYIETYAGYSITSEEFIRACERQGD